MSTPRDLIINLADALNRNGITHGVRYEDTISGIIGFNAPNRQILVSAEQWIGYPVCYRMSHLKMVGGKIVAKHEVDDGCSKNSIRQPITDVAEMVVEVRKAIATNPFSN